MPTCPVPSPPSGRRLPARPLTAPSLCLALALVMMLAVLALATLSLPARPALGTTGDPAPTGDGLLVLVEEPTANIPAPSANASFVADTYQELLGRAADNDGFNYHLARLASGGDRTREAFAFALAFSVEGSRREVVRAYDDILGRAPDGAGEAYWTAHLQGHGVVDLRVLLVASDEYRLRAGGTDGAWVDALYQDVLGRGADAGGRQYWLQRAQSGVPRALIAASIYLSEESLGRRVQALYQDVLGRSASAAEQAGAVVFIRSADERNLRARLVASDEGYEPFLAAVRP